MSFEGSLARTPRTNILRISRQFKSEYEAETFCVMTLRLKIFVTSSFPTEAPEHKFVLPETFVRNLSRVELVFELYDWKRATGRLHG